MYDPNDFDDFDTQIQPEELMDDNPIESDFEGYGIDDDHYDHDGCDDEENLIDGFCDDGMGHEQDEGSDRDNWEDEQVFHDREW